MQNRPKKIVSRVDRNVARRLREARRETGLSTRTVAGKLPKKYAVSHTTIAAFENGTAVPPVDVLAALADFYKRPINWFLEGGESLGGFRYRNLKARVPVVQQRQFEALAGKWADAYLKLDRYLAFYTKRTRKTFCAHENLRPEELAQTVRHKYLGIDDDQPILNVVSALEVFSAWALEIHAAFGIDGAATSCGDDFVIIFNPAISNDRLRLSAAHELAHVLHYECKLHNGWSDIFVEKKAYDFAANFLLPPSQLKAAFDGKSFLKLIQYKEKFGISLAAMIHTAEKSGIINTSVSRWLWKEMITRGWKSEEPGYVWRDRAITFEIMLDCAIQSKQISWDVAEKVTGIREGELRQRLAGTIEGNPKIDAEREKAIANDNQFFELTVFTQEDAEEEA
jgi:Zn-dependent peptidase ImmA (M78 family)/transcriptional regulator with XRE-family HTH domain